jgi:uncharacterized membrane protein (DUF2068 family)
METRSRPFGVTIVSILAGINGVVLIVLGIIATFILPAIIVPAIVSHLNFTTGSGSSSQMASSVAALASNALMTGGAVGIAIGVAWFVLAWGLWTAKGWAWIVTVILAIISIIFNLYGALTIHVEHIISLIIAGVILYYLYRPNVKAYFGRGSGMKISK